MASKSFIDLNSIIYWPQIDEQDFHEKEKKNRKWCPGLGNMI